MRYFLTVSDSEGRTLLDVSAPNAAGAIVELQDLIKRLRRPEIPQFDASWGESPLPILAPSDDELAAFINRASGVN